MEEQKCKLCSHFAEATNDKGNGICMRFIVGYENESDEKSKTSFPIHKTVTEDDGTECPKFDLKPIEE